MKNRSLGIILALGALMVSGCAMLSTVSRPEAGKPIPGDTVTLVGRIIFDPQVVQTFTGLNADGMKAQVGGKFYAMLTRKPPATEGGFVPEFVINDTMNEYFLATLPRGPLTWLNVLVYRELDDSSTRQLIISCPFTIGFQPDDRFIYLGDFVFHLKVTNELGGVSSTFELKNEYVEARKRFEGKILGPDGSPLALQKRIPDNILSVHVEELKTKSVTIYSAY